MKPFRLVLLPVYLLWTAVRLLFWPTVIIAAAWWLLPHVAAAVITAVMTINVAVAIRLSRRAVRNRTARFLGIPRKGHANG